MGLAELETIVAEAMVVQASGAPAEILAGRSVASTLDYLPGLAVVSQGVPDGQSDLQVEGSSFSGAGLALAGLVLGNAQTEHFNAELPVDPFLLTAPQALSGIDQMRDSDGYLVGSLAFDLVPADVSGSYVSVGTDDASGGWVSGALREIYASERWEAAGTLFGASRDLSDVDNLGNDLESWRAGGMLQAGGLDLVLAYGEKQFGATGYYGVNPGWMAEEKTRDALVLGRYAWESGDGSRAQLAASWRRFRDDYRLNLPSGGLYRNEHRTDTYGVALSETRLLGDGAWVEWRLSSTTERIRSSNLGDHSRSRFNGLLLPTVEWGRWQVSAGVHGTIFEEDETLMPLAEIAYKLPAAWRVALSYRESEREPSYTELNYESPASLGNAGLRNQQAARTALALSGPLGDTLSFRGTLFHRDEQDSVDWIRADAEATRWEAANLDGVETLGLDVGLEWRPHDRLDLGLWVQGLDKEADAPPYASRYLLDYAELLAQFNLLWRATSWLELDVVQQYRRQAENRLRQDRDGVLGRVALYLQLPGSRLPRLTLDVTNPWDDDLERFPGQPTYAPRRISVSLSSAW